MVTNSHGIWGMIKTLYGREKLIHSTDTYDVYEVLATVYHKRKNGIKGYQYYILVDLKEKSIYGTTKGFFAFSKTMKFVDESSKQEVKRNVWNELKFIGRE